MKKYLFKIIPIFLTIVIFPMASGLCFQNFSGSMLKTKVAVAATIEYGANSDQAGQLDVCDNETSAASAATSNFDYQVPAANPHSSVLPCCVDGAHPGLTILSQSVTFDKFVAALVFTQTQTLPENSKTIIYHNPIIPPPELCMVKTAVLRL
jgi:hypothetical protein